MIRIKEDYLVRTTHFQQVSAQPQYWDKVEECEHNVAPSIVAYFPLQCCSTLPSFHLQWHLSYINCKSFVCLHCQRGGPSWQVYSLHICEAGKVWWCWVLCDQWQGLWGVVVNPAYHVLKRNLAGNFVGWGPLQSRETSKSHVGHLVSHLLNNWHDDERNRSKCRWATDW